MFDPLAFQALRKGSWGADLAWQEALSSTQDILRERVRQGPVSVGTVLGAESQSAGRGRWGRGWEGQPGQSLLFTVVLPGTDLRGSLTQAPLVLGLGLHQALGGLGLRNLGLRWPNDLTVGGKKIAGLLLEQEGPQLLLGLGLNVGQDPEGFSPELQGRASSLKLCGCKELRREPLLALVLAGLEKAWLRWQSEGFEPLRMEWEAAAEGKEGLLEVLPTAGPAWRGTWAGLHESGALQLKPASGGIRLLISGEVQRLHFPPA
jgi:BirA family transcriptional regulator, biotin operon repressor / biotin---[acetyl-CoA-carboxylase] ligase